MCQKNNFSVHVITIVISLFLDSIYLYLYNVLLDGKGKLAFNRKKPEARPVLRFRCHYC